MNSPAAQPPFSGQPVDHTHTLMPGGAGPRSRTGPATASANAVTLDPLAGPPIPPVEAPSDAPFTLGRSSTCSRVLPDESVSRRHAQVSFRDGLWFISDMGSTHGTLLNSSRLEANAAAPIKAGDIISIGPWTFRVRFGQAAPAHQSLLDDGLGDGTSHGPSSRQRVERIHEREMAAITQQRLNLLMECASAVVGIDDEKELARIMLDAAIQGTGFPRAALLRDAGADVEVVLDMDPSAAPGAQKTFSKSLIQEARKGEMVKLVVEDMGNASASIMMLKIQAALCAPIKIGDVVSGFLYLDARAGEKGGRAAPRAFGAPGAGGSGGGSGGGPGVGGAGGGVPHDATTFVQAVAKMCSLASGNLARAQLEKRQAELVRDLDAAREAQKMIMPADVATIAGVRYAMRMKPGRMVAGDLFDVVQLDEHRTAIFLGDVAGKGISAAILMATAQTYLNAALKQHLEPGRALNETNKHICAHAASNKFISLWLGVFDARTKTVTYVDAGHGYWMVATPDGQVQKATDTSGIPLGIDDSFDYPERTVTLAPGARLLVFSDGVAEQPGGSSAAGAAGAGMESDMFSVERAMAAVAGDRDVEDDAKRLFDAVLAFAGTDNLADDTTVASARFE